VPCHAEKHWVLTLFANSLCKQHFLSQTSCMARMQFCLSLQAPLEYLTQALREDLQKVPLFNYLVTCFPLFHLPIICDYLCSILGTLLLMMSMVGGLSSTTLEWWEDCVYSFSLHIRLFFQSKYSWRIASNILWSL
jgi:hypothetical protein